MKANVVAISFLFCAGCLKVMDGFDLGAIEFDAGPPRRRPDSSRPRVDAGQPGPGSFRITVTGERFSREGYPFPPSEIGAPAFVDGWQLRIDHILVAIDKVALWDNPDKSASDPTQVDAKLAEARGPWIVDLHRGPPGLSDGGVSDGGAEDGGIADGGLDALAVEITNVIDQNLAGHLPFDPAKRYAVSFDIVRATTNAHPVNLDSDGMNQLTNMVSGGYSVYYIGSATWRGTPDTCLSTDAGFNFSSVHTAVTFRLGFRTPTTYINCQNPELPGPGIGGEAHPRGAQAATEALTTVQLTLRADQTFWEDYDHADAPLHFDQFAVRSHGSFGTYSVQLERVPPNDNTVNENYTAFPIPWRWCSPELTGYLPPDTHAWMDFEQGRFYDPSLPTNLSSDAGYRDYYDLVSHLQSGQGYLNGHGRCAVQRQFPSRP